MTEPGTAEIARLEGVSFRYPGAGRLTLSGVDWAIPEGSFTLVAGPSGGGKSTLLRTLNGLVPHYSGGRFGGRVTVGGLDTRRHGPRDLAATVGFVFQDPEAQLVTTRVEDEIAFGPEQFGMPRAEMRVRVEESLDLVGIAHLRHRDVVTLSGGERQRLAVAAALALRPRLLVLDEPTSQLDPWSAEGLVAGLVRLNHDLGLTVVLAEHRLERLAAEADRLLYVRADGDWLHGDPRAALTSLTIPDAALPPVTRLGRALRWAPLPLTVREARRFAAIAPRRPVAPTVADAAPGDALLVARGLRFGHRVPGVTSEVLRGVDLAIGEGERVALMGRNASGKTTLLRGLAGLATPLAGSVAVRRDGSAPFGPPPGDGLIGYLPQDPGAILFTERVRDELLASHRAAGERAGLPDIDGLLARLGLDHLADRHPRSLSGGERQRVAVGAVLAGGPRLVLMDEPTRGMDGARKGELAGLIRSFAADGIAFVIATHDIELTAGLASRVVMLGGGEVVADGAPRAVLGPALSYGPQTSRVYGPEFLTVESVLAGLR